MEVNAFPGHDPEVIAVIVDHTMCLGLQQRYLLESILKWNCSFVVGPKDGGLEVFETLNSLTFRVANVASFSQFLLYCSSPVSEVMFLGEVDEQRSSLGKVTQINPFIFYELLEHTSSFEIRNGALERSGLEGAGLKLLLVPLVPASLAKLRNKVDAWSVWRIIKLALVLRDEALIEVCVKVLQRDTLSCISGPSFLEASEEGVALLLEQEVTSLDSEFVLISAVESWAQDRTQACGKTVREILEPRLLSKLRFLALTPEEFIIGPGVATWLSSDEKRAIMNNFLKPGKIVLPAIICKNANPRCSFKHPRKICNGKLSRVRDMKVDHNLALKLSAALRM